MARSDARPRTDAGPGTGALARVGAALFQALADARARVADLGAELEAVIAAAAATPTDDEHDAEGATVGFERARIAALLEGAMAQLGELEIAERRFTAGEGWRCVQCGLEIPPERVAALPATTRCVVCAGGTGADQGGAHVRAARATPARATPAQATPARATPGVRPVRTFGQAATVLAASDPVLARLVEGAGPPKLAPPLPSHLAALVRSIVHQQLAGSAAAAIHGRLLEVLGGEVTASGLLALDLAAYRTAGLSGTKAASLLDLAGATIDGRIDLAPRRVARLRDDEIVTRLSAVRGIGRWTAEMFLLFQLRRLDVWPTGDLGVRRGYGLAFDCPMPAPRELESLGDPYRPYRSVVAWYCWRACELYGGARTSAVTA